MIEYLLIFECIIYKKKQSNMLATCFIRSDKTKQNIFIFSPLLKRLKTRAIRKKQIKFLVSHPLVAVFKYFTDAAVMDATFAVYSPLQGGRVVTVVGILVEIHHREGLIASIPQGDLKVTVFVFCYFSLALGEVWPQEIQCRFSGYFPRSVLGLSLCLCWGGGLRSFAVEVVDKFMRKT